MRIYSATELRDIQQQWLDGCISFLEYLTVLVLVEGQIEAARANGQPWAVSEDIG